MARISGTAGANSGITAWARWGMRSRRSALRFHALLPLLYWRGPGPGSSESRCRPVLSQGRAGNPFCHRVRRGRLLPCWLRTRDFPARTCLEPARVQSIRHAVSGRWCRCRVGRSGGRDPFRLCERGITEGRDSRLRSLGRLGRRPNLGHGFGSGTCPTPEGWIDLADALWERQVGLSLLPTPRPSR
jgi:hypothetical protein